jgi:hypothetical protein
MLVTLDGASQRADSIREQDFLVARNEFDPDGPLVLKRVEEVFTRVAQIVELVVNGRIIGTTAEHPFFVVRHQRFIPANELEVGDEFLSHDGQLVKLEAIRDTGRVETVYNFRVADFHTYFVGGREWGWSVWAHNDYARRMSAEAKEAHALRYAEDVRNGKATDWGSLSPKQQRAVKEYAASKGYADGELLHNNSLNSSAPARGYVLRDRDSGEPLKYGETTMPGTSRYSQEYLDENNARMVFEASGTKREMHAWQNRQIVDYAHYVGLRPPLNKSDW